MCTRWLVWLLCAELRWFNKLMWRAGTLIQFALHVQIQYHPMIPGWLAHRSKSNEEPIFKTARQEVWCLVKKEKDNREKYVFTLHFICEKPDFLIEIEISQSWIYYGGTIGRQYDRPAVWWCHIYFARLRIIQWDSGLLT